MAVTTGIGQLETMLEKTDDPLARISVLNDLSEALIRYDPNRALDLSQQAYKLEEQCAMAGDPCPEGMAHSLTNRAAALRRLSRYQEAISTGMEAIEIYQTLDKHQQLIRAMTVLGSACIVPGYYLESLDWLLQALQLSRDEDERALQAEVLNQLGIVHVHLDETETALSYLQQSQQLAARLGLDGVGADSLSYTSYVLLQDEAYDEAEKNARRSLSIYRKMDTLIGQCEVLNVLAQVHARRDDIMQAVQLLEESRDIAHRTGDRQQEIESLMHEARVYLQAGRTAGLVEQLASTLEMAQEIESKQQIYNIHKLLSEAYRQVGDFENALLHYTRYHETYHQIFNEDADYRRMGLRTAYNVEATRKQADNYRHKTELLKREVSRRQEAEDRLNQRIEELTVVLQVFDEINSSLHADFVSLLSLDAALRLSGGRMGFIALRSDEDSNNLRYMVITGQYDMEEGDSLIVHPDLLQRLIETTLPLILTRDDEDYDIPVHQDSVTRVVIPLLSQETFVGLIQIETDKEERFSNSAMQLLRLMQRYLAIGLDNARLYQKVENQLSELQDLYDQVSQLELLKTDMIRIAAHDLQNPVSVIKGYAQLMGMYGPLNEKQKKGVKTIDGAANRMSAMIANILSLERIEQMAKTGLTDTVRLQHEVIEVFEMYRQQAEDKSLIYTLTADDTTSLLISGDRSQLHEAISNLIGNAIKYTPDEGSVDVSLHVSGEQLIFRVVDTGYGIPEDQQEKLFQPFFRAEMDEINHITGNGLGLHLVKNIVNRHGGKMIFQSKRGEGSTFGFRLPLTIESDDDDEA